MFLEFRWGDTLYLEIQEETCDWHSRGGSATYDIMYNGGYVTLPTMMGNRRNEIGFVSRPTTILFPLSRLHLPCDLAYLTQRCTPSHVSWPTLDMR